MAEALARPLLIVSLAALSQLVSVELWLPAPRMHLLWLPGALLMCWLLVTPLRRAWVPIISVCAGVGAVLVPLGLPLLQTLALVVGHSLLILATAVLVRIPPGDMQPLENGCWVFRFVLLCVVVLPLLAAGMSCAVMQWLGLAPWLGSWSNIALAHAASYALVVPPFISMARHRPGASTRPSVRQLTVIGMLGLLFLLACWLPLGDPFITQPVLLLLSFCVMIFMLLSFGPASAFISLLVLTLACMQITVAHGFPPPLGDGRRSVLAVQIWSITLACALLALVVVAEQRRALRDSLRSAYDRLTELTGRMLLVQEEERARIARELHDDISQSLAAISIQLSGLRRELSAPQRQKLISIHEDLLQVSSDVRQISHDLHPSILRFTSLASALESLCQTYGGEMRVQCLADADIPLDEKQKINLFRIAQESLHNVESHARARHCVVRLGHAAGFIFLRIEDDGVGLPETVMKGLGGGLGMVTMEERARLIDGQLSLHRLPSGGSAVEVRLSISAWTGPSPPSWANTARRHGAA